MTCTLTIDNVDFDDIMRKGPEWGIDLLRGAIGRELNDHDRRLRGLTSIKIRESKNTKVEDLLKLLEYKRGGV